MCMSFKRPRIDVLRTTLLSCLDVSSIPTESFEIATEISSLAGSFVPDMFDGRFCIFPVVTCSLLFEDDATGT